MRSPDAVALESRGLSWRALATTALPRSRRSCACAHTYSADRAARRRPSRTRRPFAARAAAHRTPERVRRRVRLGAFERGRTAPRTSGGRARLHHQAGSHARADRRSRQLARSRGVREHRPRRLHRRGGQMLLAMPRRSARSWCTMPRHYGFLGEHRMFSSSSRTTSPTTASNREDAAASPARRRRRWSDTRRISCAATCRRKKSARNSPTGRGARWIRRAIASAGVALVAAQ